MIVFGPVTETFENGAECAQCDVLTASGDVSVTGPVTTAARLGLVIALAAWEEVGALPGDRIEHGAVIPLELLAQIANLGLTVVTQPGFIADRGDDYLRDVELHDQPHLWRCGSLLDAGIAVGGSTDAPFGPADPWIAIASAVDRQTPHGSILGPNERINAQAALDMLLTPPSQPGGRPRSVSIGSPANLCLLNAPLEKALTTPSSAHVRSAIIRGKPSANRSNEIPVTSAQ